jgi:hypothetical protein
MDNEKTRREKARLAEAARQVLMLGNPGGKDFVFRGMVAEDEYLETYGQPPAVGALHSLSDKAPPRGFRKPEPIGFQPPLPGLPRPNPAAGVKLWYMATPYTNYPHGKEAAFRMAARAAAVLMEADVPVFSPITHSHPIEGWGGLTDKNHDFWMRVDRAIFDRCDGLIVVTAEGWLTSRGVQMEVGWAEALSRPVVYMKEGEVPEELKFYGRN